MTKTRHLIILALFVSQALILSLLESWLSIPSPVPGVKPGLANIITVAVLVFFGLKDAIGVVTVRSILAAFFAGGMVMLPYSLAGGLLATLVMYLLLNRGKDSISLAGVSIAGAVFHNIGQLVVAAFMTGGFAVFAYLPVLLVSGVAAGFLTGLVSGFLIKALKRVKLLSEG